MVEASKRRAAEYLLAAQKALDQPTTEDFMLLADGTDLNPTMLIRWQVYLARTRKDARRRSSHRGTPLRACRMRDFARSCSPRDREF